MKSATLFEERLTHSVIGAFYEVYRNLGFGFLEQFYLMALERELRKRNHLVGREVVVPVCYKGELLGTQRLDMVVDSKLIIESKATHELPAVSRRQLFNYLRATGLEVGLLLHFGPQPRFFRMIHRTGLDSELPTNSPFPSEKSV